MAGSLGTLQVLPVGRVPLACTAPGGLARANNLSQIIFLSFVFSS